MRDEVEKAIQRFVNYDGHDTDSNLHQDCRDLVLLGVRLGLEAAAKECDELDDWRNKAWWGSGVDGSAAAHGAGKCATNIRAIEPAKVVE